MSRTVLITGSSSGFGLEATVALASRGWQVHASMRDPARSGRLDERVAAAGLGQHVEIVALDVADSTSRAQAVASVLERTGGHLDAVVNNAGVSVGGTFEDVPVEDLRQVIETNFFGTVEVTRLVLPAMRRQRSGRIVAVTSSGAFFSSPGLSAYAASKWAVEGWAESLAFEVAPFGIHVICVEPGGYATGIWDASPRVMPSDSPYAEMTKKVEQFVNDKIIPSARDPKEVGAAIAKALEAARPRFRYPVGPDAVAQHLAKGVVPNRLSRAALTRYIGLDGSPG